MGSFEEKLRERFAEIIDDVRLIDNMVEEILGDHCEVYALWAIRQVMEAQSEAAKCAAKRDNKSFQFYQGRIHAFNEIFIRAAFDGRSLSDGTITNDQVQEAVKFWTEKAEQLVSGIIM